VRVIADGIENTTVSAVEHKHGASYGEATRKGFQLAGGVGSSAKHLFEWSHIWLYAGIEMAASALESPPGVAVCFGGTWQEGYLSIFDKKLGWCIKFARLKSRSIVFYNRADETKGTGVLPLVAVRKASIWKETTDKKPGTFRIYTHKITEWLVSPDCSEDPLNRQGSINPLEEAQLWILAINALASVQQV